MLPGCLWVLPPEEAADWWPWTALWPRPASDELAGILAGGAGVIAETARFIDALDWLLGG